jgi:predicted nucleic acid-binding protein
MTLVDTSVWVSHFRSNDPELVSLLEEGLAGSHPFVVGELAAGTLKDRAHTVKYLGDLPVVSLATEVEVLRLVEAQRLWGLGLGWVDLHLLASASIARWNLLTADRVMKGVAAKLRINSPA